MAIITYSDGSKLDTSTNQVVAGKGGSSVSSTTQPISYGGSTFNVTPSQNIVNPGSVWQTYDPKTGQTTYGQAPSIYGGTGQAVETPQNLPKGTGTPYVATSTGQFTALKPTTAYVTNPLTGKIEQNVAGTVPFNMPTVTVPDKVSAVEVAKAGTEGLGDALTAAKAKAQIPAGSLIRDPGQLKYLKESDIARTTGAEIYRRNVALEQQKMAEFVQKTGIRPSNDAQWRQFHDFVYKPQISGGNNQNPDSQKKASPDISKEDGTVDVPTLMQQVQTQLDDFNKLIADETKMYEDQLAEVEAGYGQNIADLGAQLGTTYGLIQGEQAYQENKKQIEMDRVERRKTNTLNRVVAEKQAFLESANMKMQLLQYYETLRQDQRDAAMATVSMFANAGVALKGSEAANLAGKIGISQKALEDLFAAAAKNKLVAESNIDYKQVGVDSSGNPIYGFVDTSKQTVTIPQGKTTSSMGELTVTGVGSDKWANGLDVVLTDSVVKYPFGDTGEVIFAGNNGGFGNQVKIRTTAGDEIWLSHLNNINVKVGDKVSSGSKIGIQGNTGTVIPLNGGDGTHVDITMKDKNGNFYSPGQVAGIIGVNTMQDSTPQNYVYEPGKDITVDSWASRIQSGQSKLTEIPASNKGLRDKVTIALYAMGNTPDGKPTVTEMGKEALKSAKLILQKIGESGSDWDNAIGVSATMNKFAIPGTDRSDALIAIQSLKNQLSLDAVKYLKGQGQVSDAERALLSSAVTRLNPEQSEGEFINTLNDIINRLSGTPTPTSAQQIVTAPDGTIIVITD